MWGVTVNKELIIREASEDIMEDIPAIPKETEPSWPADLQNNSTPFRKFK